jgi:hypothetical protein
LIKYKAGCAPVPDEVFITLHAQILAEERWVIDGFGNAQSFAATLREADVLVYVERAPLIHCWWVTKRLLLSPFTKPLGWPEGANPTVDDEQLPIPEIIAKVLDA